VWGTEARMRSQADVGARMWSRRVTERGGREQEANAVASPADCSELLGPVGPVERLGTMSAVGTAGELQDRGAVDQAIEKRRG